ncbi:trypsin-like serine protease [Luteimonas viscosa]|uniref:Trypsin-like serine protease n=1 Tax=Luteimonas viscosa TaxID=1132694 RepID=A0A5D4XU52_9GAMM|nr:trypsin-like serine protease [Luteimonas viscosa]TYT27021.1 trypsin-like serine protease [Luteimonas viscosa]
MLRLLLLSLLAATSSASAVVIRHDVDDTEYRVTAAEFPALVDMPGEGHGVLVEPRWVVTAAHTIPSQPGPWQVVINGVPRNVERVVTHPGYKLPPHALIHQAMATGEAVLVLVLLASSDDIAMLKLSEAVTDVVPAPLYLGSDEANRIVRILGKGAAGTGAIGHDPQGPNRTELRRAFNTVTSAHERWFCYVFDAPPSGLPLEGILGNGDSGGPALIEVDGQWRLAGLASWKFLEGDVRTVWPGRYGQSACNVRISHYASWIEGVIAGEPPAAG